MHMLKVDSIENVEVIQCNECFEAKLIVSIDLEKLLSINIVFLLLIFWLLCNF